MRAPARPANVSTVGSRHGSASGRGRVIDEHVGQRSAIRVGVIDDHPSVVAGLADAVRAAPGLTLAATGSTLGDALRMLADIDVLVCDLQLAGGAEGLRVVEAALGAAVGTGGAPPAVVLLSGFDQPSLVRAAIERGAAGFLSKSADVATILDAIRTVAAGGTVFSAAMLRSTQSAVRSPSDRERQVIALVVGGATNAEAASALDLSEKTVESHLRRLFDRYGLLSRTELAVLAIREGWVPVPVRDA